MNKTATRVGAVSIGAALGVAGLGAVAEAAQQPTGRACNTEYFFNGQGAEITGHRCATAKVTYAASDTTHWQITSYQILYTVTDGLDYGPHNNEDPASISDGYYAGGAQSWLSPDSGA